MLKRFKKILFILVIFGFLGILAGVTFIFYIWQTLPPPTLIEERRVAESTKIYDRTGEILLYEIHGEERRTIIPLAEIPEIVRRATIAVEDAGFYDHPAFDWKSIIRAFLANLKQGQIVQGGSTITQQLAKNAFLTSERTLTRKIKELVLAFELERNFTKDQILELYLNQIPYGSNAYGIESASQIYFEKSVADLNLAEVTILASLPKAPSFYSPWGKNKEALFERQIYVLAQMLQAGFITEKVQKEAVETKISFSKPLQGIRAPHFVMMVQDYLVRQYGENFVRVNGLKVITTLAWPLQQLAEQAVAEGAARNTELYQGKNAALVAQDSNTGQILALVGSKDYFDTENDGNFNVAAQGLRQPGSAIKPFVYAAAFRKGYTPETMVFDLATEFDTTGQPEKSYKPVNYDGEFRGPLTLRKALGQSVNVPAVKVLYLVGLDEALRTARDFGLSTLRERSRYGLSLVLGGGEVKL
ncbi:MAG: penicillin-binding protein, partial [Parcubacteria group bacterium Gr01-1014_73]